MKLPSEFAPYKIAILPLSKKPELQEVAQQIVNQVQKHVSIDYDETQSIGKRYRRQDEIGTPYCVTIDFESLEDKQVTIRDRDSMTQDRIPMDKLLIYIQDKGLSL